MTPTRYQPQGALRISRGMFASGMRLASLPGVNRGYNAVSSTLSTVIGVKPQVCPTGLSGGFGSNWGVTSTDRITSGLVGSFPSTGRSYLFRFRRNGPGGGNLGRLFDKTNGSTGQMIYWSNAANAVVYSSYVGGAEQAAVVGLAPLGEWVTLIVTHYQDGQNRILTAYSNGEATQFIAVITGTPNDAPATALTIGNRASDGIRGWDGLIECAYVWDRILTPDEAMALYRNPYAAFDNSTEDPLDLIGLVLEYISTQPSAGGVSVVSSLARSIAHAYTNSVGISGANTPAYTILQVMGLSSGYSTITPQSRSVVSPLLSSVGNSYVVNSANALQDAIASAVGMSSISSNTAIVVTVSGESNGESAVQALCVVIFPTDASSTSVAEITSITQSIVHSFAYTEGTSTVEGVTSGGHHYTATGDKFAVTIVFSQYCSTVDNKPITVTIS